MSITTLVLATLLVSSSAMRQAVNDEVRQAREMENEAPIRSFLISNRCYVRGYLIHEDQKKAEVMKALLKYAEIEDGKPRTSIFIPRHQWDITYFNLLFDRLFVTTKTIHANLMLYNLSDLLNGDATTGDAANKRPVKWAPDAWIFEENERLIHYRGGNLDQHMNFNFLPVSHDSVRLFRLSTQPTDAIGTGHYFKKGDTPFFRSYKYEAKWDAKEAKWVPGTWSEPEKLETAFNEPFHVYGLDDNYYFVTKSGKVFVSPPRKADVTGLRKVTPLWTDPQQPITHILTDVDGPTPRLTYGFGNSSRPDAKKKQERFYIKLQGQDASPSYFRVGQLQPALEADQPLKTMLEYSRLIRFGPQQIDDDVAPATESARWWWYLVAACLVAAVAVAAYRLRRKRAAEP